MMAKKVVLFTVIAILFLTSCRSVEEDDEDVFGVTDNSIFEAYIFRSHNIFSQLLPHPVSGVLVDGDDIVYWYVDSEPEIVITTITEDGQVKQITRLPAQGLRVDVGGLYLTNDGNIALIIVEDLENNRSVVTYNIYDRQGVEISSTDISNVFARGHDFIHIKQVVFADDGNMAIVVDDIGPFNDVFLLDNKGNMLGQLQINSALNIGKLRDDRVVALQRDRFIEGAGVSLREIVFATGDWGDTIPLTIPGSIRLLSAGAGQHFDLIVDDGRFLYGYTIETHTQTPILDWVEVGVIATFDNHICILPDDRIIVLQTQMFSSNDENEWDTDFYILSRISRDEVPQKMVLTIGGYFFDEDLRREVIAYNRDNNDYQIELQQFNFSDLDRLRVEMVTTGTGPDIFLDHPTFPVGSEFFADLYKFIDADPVIDRADFFPSVLSLLETNDGALPVITQHFYLHTNVTTRDTAAQIMPLTFTNLLRRLNEPDAPELFGEQANREYYAIQAVATSGDTFIDFTNNRANLDGDEFISMLEIAYRLPEYQGEAGGSLQPFDEVENVRNGKQLLLPVILHQPGNFRHYTAFFDDFVAVGLPTDKGGQHAIIMMWERFGINAKSAHQDAAWDFIRRFYLPETEVPPYGIPLRIDSYEKHIANLMIRNVVNGMEVPQQVTWHGHQLEIYAMAEEEAVMLRGIIDNVTLLSRQDMVIDTLLDEEIPQFLSGARSASETARVLQNRVQRYLDERG